MTRCYASASTSLATLTLRFGRSLFDSWTFTTEDVGSAITVGSGEDCDWRITGEGVGFRELQLLVSPRGLRVRPLRGDLPAHLNSEPLDASWTTLHDGAHLDFGAACLSVSVTPQCNVARHTDSGVRAMEPPIVVVGRDVNEEFALGDTLVMQAVAEPAHRATEVPPLATRSVQSGDPCPHADVWSDVSEGPGGAEYAASVLPALCSTPLLTWGRACMALGCAAAYGGWIVLLDLL